ncbi:Mitochondrial Carrier (MC) Family [Thraustotheca clavata]|uniref:Mitochondrial Carrier (MC) Family n=1 Tax=Thraustotheca clavata TaxID=74557 RepID=A0A1V9Y6S5_9STRA|nr:Mitochondrial Carrier (MC) Family [Thraustotheca clavata]
MTSVMKGTSEENMWELIMDPKYRHFIGGAIGGMTAAIITSPLEVIKTRLQTKLGRSDMARAGNHNLSTLNVLRTILRNESVFGLWRGITPNLLGVIPARAAYFGCYAKFKNFCNENGFSGTATNFGSAAAAGCMTASVLSPIFVVKTRMQLMPTHTVQSSVNVYMNCISQSLPVNGNQMLRINLNGNGASMALSPVQSSPKFYSMNEVAYKMYKEEGTRAFFKGLSASYWGVSEGAIQLALYEEFKSRIDEPTKLELFFLAGLCKLTAAAATYPHEVVRTRMRDQRTPTDGSPTKYRGMFQSIATIYKSEGTRGLYGGMPAHLMKTVPNAAIMYVVLEMIVAS